ncbi:MAG: GIY-YIG nuclease family protein [Candidatus Magasanikbacteria bacterium]|jgi:putative endonuclease|nr:GIY-YIG nuclease family protein [Candidatus Magasanikbacteria bacterium]MBT4314951.1 GIY-YIG nuclease family protein [Candidatus Magasanikbacteria bacterium]MBT4546907.1 GIY-YIG nuclease family protein [Candidatus Magasanikbacteria bacterium]MBT6819179.1 GIY-YIG nuclease family protein [Candidatus Magasanikbacteria bacterium]
MIPRRKNYYVYVTASISKVIYIGFTNCLVKRINQHKKGTFDNAFTKKYKVNRLIYWEHFHFKHEAMNRERELKGWLRKRKIELIEKNNKDWNDLYDNVVTMSKIRPLF